MNLYPTAATKCCIPLLPPNVVYRFVATKCCKLDKKNDYRRWGGGKKNDFWWFYTPLLISETNRVYMAKDVLNANNFFHSFYS